MKFNKLIEDAILREQNSVSRYLQGGDRPNMSDFRLDTNIHSLEVKGMIEKACDLAYHNVVLHDNDKRAYDDLSSWLDYFNAGNHFDNPLTSKHHKECVSNLFEVIEMLADWCSATAMRQHHSLSEDLSKVRIPYLPWKLLILNTISILDQFRNEYINELMTEKHHCLPSGSVFDQTENSAAHLAAVIRTWSQFENQDDASDCIEPFKDR